VCDKKGRSAKPEPVNEDDETSFPEGEAKYETHRRYERDPRVARIAKNKRLREKGYLECDACGFCFQDKYGARGVGFIEAHHNIPVSSLGAQRKTKIREIALVCSNCHRMLHRAYPWLSVEALKKLIAKS
jgi:predicted HNH restriction endonuclease